MSDNSQMFHVSGCRKIEVDIVGESPHSVARQFMKVNGFYPEIIHDLFNEYVVISACECCNDVIMDSDNYGYCSIDGTYLCKKCLDERADPVDE